jgi:hypothetical protein
LYEASGLYLELRPLLVELSLYLALQLQPPAVVPQQFKLILLLGAQRSQLSAVDSEQCVS